MGACMASLFLRVCGAARSCGSIQDSINDNKPNGGSKQGGFGGHGFAKNTSDATALGIRAGCDMNCGDVYVHGIAAAVASGMLHERDIDTSLLRAFTMRMRLGEFDRDVVYRDLARYGRGAMDTPSPRELALQVM